MNERWVAIAVPLIAIGSALFVTRSKPAELPAAPAHSLTSHEGPALPEGIEEPLVAVAWGALHATEQKHEERFRAATKDPEEQQRDLRRRLSSVPAGDSATLVSLGHELFVTDLAIEPRQPLHSSGRCAACHSRGHTGGAGGLIDNYLDDLNPPALDGAGLLERVAAEITSDLKSSKTSRLQSHGIDFGTRERPQGISGDLVVRPFGRRGTWAKIDDAVDDVGKRTLGRSLDSTERYALSSWIRSLAPPISLPPDPARLTDLFAAYESGRNLFETLGCAGCHVPELVLQDGTRVRAYSDLKRHEMGPKLAANGSSLWLTAPLWGCGDSQPYLHDGHAISSLDEAIAKHGGEGEQAAKAYASLNSLRQGEIKVFLLSLVPEPGFRIAGE